MTFQSKSFKITMGILIGLIAIVLVIGSTSESDQAAEDEDEINEVELEEDNEQKLENNDTEESDENLDEEDNTTFSQEELEDLSLSILEDNFQEMARVDFNREQKEFLITSTDPAFDEELLYMIENDVVLDDWNFLVDSFTYMSESIYDLLGSGYTLQLVNPFNEKNTLLTIVDGYVIYNAFE